MASFTFILSEAIHLKWYRPTILRLWLELGLGLVGLGLGLRLVGLGLVGLDFRISRVRVMIEFRVIVL